MDYAPVVKNIQDKKLAPLYLLQGDEAYYIDKISELIPDAALTPEQKDFNYTVFYGKDANVQEIMNTCRKFPMFADFNVVVVREAQMLKTKGNELDKLEAYASHPAVTTILVICHKEGKMDARKKLFKNIKEKGVVFESNQLEEFETAAFIDKYMKRNKMSADEKAIALMVDYLGTDLSKITNEIDKLAINVGEGHKITVADIEKNTGISKDYNVYELQSALLTKDSGKAFVIVDYLNNNQKTNPFVLTISNIHSAYIKLYQYLSGGNVRDWDLYKLYQIHSSQSADYRKAGTIYSKQRVEKIFGIIIEYDLRSKGVHNNETSYEELLREMVIRILD